MRGAPDKADQGSNWRGANAESKETDLIRARAMNADKKSEIQPAEEEGPTTRQRNNRIHALCISLTRGPHVSDLWLMCVSPQAKLNPYKSSVALSDNRCGTEPRLPWANPTVKFMATFCILCRTLNISFKGGRGERVLGGWGKVVHGTDSNARQCTPLQKGTQV